MNELVHYLVIVCKLAVVLLALLLVLSLLVVWLLFILYMLCLSSDSDFEPQDDHNNNNHNDTDDDFEPVQKVCNIGCDVCMLHIVLVAKYEHNRGAVCGNVMT